MLRICFITIKTDPVSSPEDISFALSIRTSTSLSVGNDSIIMAQGGGTGTFLTSANLTFDGTNLSTLGLKLGTGATVDTIETTVTIETQSTLSI